MSTYYAITTEPCRTGPPIGRALDMQGRRTVDLAPRTVGAISICGVGDADKTQRISRGRSI